MAQGGWDQHPLTREKLGSCDLPGLSVVGQRGSQGWNVALLGQGVAIVATPEQARRLAAALNAMADICEGQPW